MTPEEIRDRFSYHVPSLAGVERHKALTSTFSATAATVDDACPDSREKSLAMTKLEEAKFWASAAVARNTATR